jgi:multidrug efflux pump subunit AcrB
MWIVQVALRRPYTFIVLALLLPLIGGLAIMGTPLSPGMPTDIFPDIKIPVIAVTFQYAGMPPDDMAGRITAQIERYATTVVNDIEHVESRTYPGMAVVKIFFQPGVDINLAMAQVTAFGQTSLRFMPAGVQPPLILKYNAATVPILQLAMSSNTLTESQLFDTGNQVVRTQIGTVYGAAIPYPYGGAARQVQIDLKPDALRAQGLTASDVNNAITNQNLIVPAGTQKIGDTEYNVKLNASPFNLDEINDLPIRGQAGGNVTYIRDVAFVHDGHPPQTNIVRVDGRRAVLMTIQKTGAASTLNIVNEIRSRLPRVRELLPAGASIDATGDQSVFVRDAVKGVVVEAVLAACLTALMVLLFLGSWRDFHPAVHHRLYHHPRRARRDDQPHDARRTCARGGDTGGRRDRHDREHQPAFGIRSGGRARHPQGLVRDHDSCAGLDSRYLYRVRTDVSALGRGALSVRATG